MKRKIITILTTVMLCMTLGACGSREIDWGPETPEILPSTNGIVTYVTPEQTEIINISFDQCNTVSVISGTEIRVLHNGQYKDITLYGILVPEQYENEVMDYLNASLPETVYIDYINEETGSAYVWITNDVAMISGCVNYQMCYKGYAVTNPAQELEDTVAYEKAVDWACDTQSGLWIYEDIRNISVPESSVSDNGISKNSVSEGN